MQAKVTKILLIEDNPGDARLLREFLYEANKGGFELVHAERLSNAVERFTESHFDIILLDLMLPDSKGLDTFLRMRNHSGDTPIVVLSGMYDEESAVKAVHEGAQDYLVKGQVNSMLLIRAIRYAIERQKMQIALRSQSLIDDLTGLYNRRGFLALAQQQLKLSKRTKRGFFLVFVDLDRLKQVNDTYGHLEGDQALMHSAQILKKTFRETDIVARIGGDEFTVLALDVMGESLQTLSSRLEDNCKEFNTQGKGHYTLSLSFGIVYFDAKSNSSLEQLMEKADVALYNHKRNKWGY